MTLDGPFGDEQAGTDLFIAETSAPPELVSVEFTDPRSQSRVNT